MMQGDQYAIPIKGTGFDLEDVEKIEFMIGPLIKYYPDTVTYDSTEQAFIFPVTQAETFGMFGEQNAQARVKFADSSDVIGVSMGKVDVIKSRTKVIL